MPDLYPTLTHLPAPGEIPAFPAWALAKPARATRTLVQIPAFALLDLVAPAVVSGRDALCTVAPPALFVANHASHLDTPTLLRALPARWRQRVAVAAAADYFFANPWMGASVALGFNAFPFARQGTIRATLDYCARLRAAGWSIVLYPEGGRAPAGRVGEFRAGAGWLAVRLGMPVVPVYLGGLAGVLPKGRHRPQPGRVQVCFGPALQFPPGTPAPVATAAIRAAVCGLAPAAQE